MMNSTSTNSSRGFSIWPGAIFVLIGINVCVVTLTVYFAHADRSFAVEQDYYEKAIRWNQTAQQIQRNRELGWKQTMTIEPTDDPSSGAMTLRVSDADGRAINQALVKVSAFPSARASQRQALTLLEVAPGEYHSLLSNVMPGLWEFRVMIRRGDDVFTASIEEKINPAMERR